VAVATLVATVVAVGVGVRVGDALKLTERLLLPTLWPSPMVREMVYSPEVRGRVQFTQLLPFSLRLPPVLCQWGVNMLGFGLTRATSPPSA